MNLILNTRGQPIGRLYLDERQDEIRIIDIALLPANRGNGIGGRILEDILAQAQKSHKPVRIHVEKNNPAMRLYRRLGFFPVEDQGVYELLERSPQPIPATSLLSCNADISFESLHLAVALASCDKPAEHSSNEELVIEGCDVPLGGPKVEPVPRHDYQEPEAFDLNTVSSATYKPLKGTSFELVTDNGRTTPITLHEVRDLPVYPRPDGKHALRRPPFRLIFEASHSAISPSRARILHGGQCLTPITFALPGTDRYRRRKVLSGGYLELTHTHEHLH